MTTSPKKRDTREWKWGDAAMRSQPEASVERRWPGEDRQREPSRLERSARMRSARLLEPSRRTLRPI